MIVSMTKFAPFCFVNCSTTSKVSCVAPVSFFFTCFFKQTFLLAYLSLFSLPLRFCSAILAFMTTIALSWVHVNYIRLVDEEL